MPSLLVINANGHACLITYFTEVLGQLMGSFCILRGMQLCIVIYVYTQLSTTVIYASDVNEVREE